MQQRTRLIPTLTFVTLALSFPFAISFLTATKAEPAPVEKEAVASLFDRREPAKNPVRLSLQPDQHKVVGWVSGMEDFSGKEVMVAWNGEKQHVQVGKDNTFVWTYAIDKPTTATFSLGKMEQRVALTRPPEHKPTSFFIVDRSAYRPGQTLHFACFLRQLDRAGEFVPLAKRAVDVELTSQTKQSLAAKLSLESDDFGRIVGSYAFSDADALDNYTLSIADYEGTAPVYLGEFRKSQVKLTVDGQISDGTLKLQFQAVDFMDRPVGGTNVNFTAQIVQSQSGADKKFSLNGGEFVHSDGYLPIDPDTLSRDELLLWDAGLAFTPDLFLAGDQVVAQVTGEVKLKDKTPGGRALSGLSTPRRLRGKKGT
jgi:hypothetical protein